MVLITLARYAAAAIGAARRLRWRMGPAGWLILVTVLYFLLIPGPVAHARFRVPVEPLLSVVAAAGLVGLGTGGARKRPAEKITAQEA